MTLDEAKAECERWFRSLKWDEEKSLAMQRLAAGRRDGSISEQAARREMSKWGSAPRVFDGANLEKAVRVILKHCNKG